MLRHYSTTVYKGEAKQNRPRSPTTNSQKSYNSLKIQKFPRSLPTSQGCQTDQLPTSCRSYPDETKHHPCNLLGRSIQAKMYMGSGTILREAQTYINQCCYSETLIATTNPTLTFTHLYDRKING